MRHRAHTQFFARLMAGTAALATLGIADGAEAQTAAAANDAKTNAPADIIVLGTRRSDRTVTTSASPIDVISAGELNTQPADNLLDSIKNIVPSFFVPQNTISDASSFVRSPSLRGLPGDEVLVQLNGKRYNRSALVQVYAGGDTGLGFGSQGSDISAIPSIAIKNLQILRDGATAQYGSDAIAGVMDFGLKDANHGLQVEGKYGQYYDHGDGKSKQVAANAGFNLFGAGFVNLSGEYDDDGGTSEGATRPAAVVFAQQFPALAPQIPNYPRPAQIWGSSPTHGYKLMLNSGFDVTTNSQLYVVMNFARSFTTESFNYRPPIGGTALDTAGVTRSFSPNGPAYGTAAVPRLFYLTPCPAGNATCPAGGFVKDANTYSYLSLYPAGFTPQFVGKTTEFWDTVGWKGKLASGFTWDLSGTLARNKLNLSMYGSLSPSYGPQSQTSFFFGNLIQREYNGNLDLTYPLNVGLYSPITIAAGGEYRKESYTQTAGDPQSYGAGPYAAPQNLYTLTAPGVYTPAGATTAVSPGASGYGGTSPQAAGTFSQESYAGYLDLETDFTSRLSVGLAGRIEHYTTFGTTTVGKANALYKFSDAFSIRGTIGTGFHAPSPGQSADEILTTSFDANGNQVQTGTYPVSSVVAKAKGATTLTPEKSTNVGVGFVARPLDRLLLTVDGYSIKVRNRITISQNYTISAADVVATPALAAVGVGGQINYFTNGYNTVTRGVDVVATYRLEPAAGPLNLTLAYNYNLSRVGSYNAGTISEAQRIDVEHLAPNHRATLSANWQIGPWTLNGRENYYGYWIDAVDYPSATDAAGNTIDGQHFGAKFTSDLDLSYTFRNAFTLTAGGTNIFNVKPDKIAYNTIASVTYQLTQSLSDGEVYPRPGGPFGINGGFWYVKLRVNY